MIFQETDWCKVEFVRDLRGVDAVQLPFAPLIVLVVSVGRAAFTADSEPVLGDAGSVVIANGLLTVTPAEECHIVAAGLSGAAAQSVHLPHGILMSDGNACPMAAQLLRDIAGAEDPAHSGTLGYALLCETAGADSAAPRLPQLVADAIVAIRENYAGLYGVEELSAQLGVSKSHLVRVFGEAIGMPPGQYLTRVRIEAAKQLLVQRSYSLEVIATLCGFAGANYFCKVFRRQTGQTPGEYRAAAGRSGADNAKMQALEEMLFV